MNVNIDQVLAILGAKVVEIDLLTRRVAELEQEREMPAQAIADLRRPGVVVHPDAGIGNNPYSPVEP